MRISMEIVLVLLTTFSLLYPVYAEQATVNVPLIEGKTEANASIQLESIGLIAEFQKCFSNTERYFIIPNSQDPRAGLDFFEGEKVRADVSLGPYPILIGISENDALHELQSKNMIYKPIAGQNNSVPEGYVFDQEPKNASCIGPDFKIKIFVNTPVIIEEPYENKRVGSAATVRGSLSTDLKNNEHLWIAVKPQKSIKDWWPQTGGDIKLINGEFEANAFLGGIRNDTFEIGVLLVDDEINKKFWDWLNLSQSLNEWPPITQGHPETDQKVSKEVVEEHKIAKINVILDE